jgi:non-ribosomal peptide synthetase component F
MTMIKPDDVPRLKTLVLGGEAVKQEDTETWINRVELFNGYGPTETCVFSVSTPFKRDEQVRSAIGRAIDSLAWIVSLEDNSQLACIGSVGELWIEGPQLAAISQGEMDDEGFSLQRRSAKFNRLHGAAVSIV